MVISKHNFFLVNTMFSLYVFLVGAALYFLSFYFKNLSDLLLSENSGV